MAAAAAAKEQGGVQRSIKFPPLGGPGGLAPAGSGMLHGYGSSSQVRAGLGAAACGRLIEHASPILCHSAGISPPSLPALIASPPPPPPLPQLLSYATPSQPLTDDELGGGGEFDQEYFDRWACLWWCYGIQNRTGLIANEAKLVVVLLQEVRGDQPEGHPPAAFHRL